MTSETSRIRPTDIGRFLNFTAGFICSGAERIGKKVKPRDMAPFMEMAIAFGLLLAKRQPELIDAGYQYWSFTRSMTPEEYVDGAIDLYERYLQDIQESQ